MGILLKRFDRKPDSIISFFDMNLDFLPLQILHIDFNIYLLFFVMKASTFKSLVSFLHFKQYIIYNYISFFKKFFFLMVIKNCYNHFQFLY